MIKYMSANFDSIKNTNIKKESTMDLKKELDKIIKTTKERVEKEIPDTGYFRNFGVNLEQGTKTSFFGRDIALFVERDESRDGNAYLGLSVLHPTLDIDASVYITNGNRNHLLNYMNNNNFNTELQDAVERLSDSLKDVR